MAAAKGRDGLKAQRFQCLRGFRHTEAYIFGAMTVGTNGDAGAAQLSVMPQNIKMGQTHGGTVPKAGGVYFQPFASPDKLLEQFGQQIHRKQMVAGFIGQRAVALAVIQMTDHIKIVKLPDTI